MSLNKASEKAAINNLAALRMCFQLLVGLSG
jgi:hypothetical protein